MKKIDMIIIMIVLVLAGVFFGVNKYKQNYVEKNSNDLYAHIYVENELYKVVNISNGHSEEIKIKTDLGNNVVKIHDNGVEISEGDCDDHICKNTGVKNKAGDIIVCLPNQVFVEIKGNKEAAVDETSK